MFYQCKTCLKIESNFIKNWLWAKSLIQSDSLSLWKTLSNYFTKLYIYYEYSLIFSMYKFYDKPIKLILPNSYG